MEREQFHYHVDVMTPDSRPIMSSPALPKSAAERLFKKAVEEYRLQAGRFVIRAATPKDWEDGFIGAVRIAKNCRLVVSLTRCDCD